MIVNFNPVEMELLVGLGLDFGSRWCDNLTCTNLSSYDPDYNCSMPLDQCESNYNCNSQFLYSSSNLNIDQHSQQFQISPNLLSSHGSHNEATSINLTNATNQLGNDRLITSSLQAAPSGSITNRANNSSAIGPLSPQLGKSHNSGQSANTSSLLLSTNHNSAINSDARLPQTANYTNVNGSLTSGNNSVNFNQGLLTGSVSKQEKLPSCYNSNSLLRSTNPNVINSYPVPGNLSNVNSSSNAMGIQNQQQPIGGSGLCSPNVNASLVKQTNNAVASIGGQYAFKFYRFNQKSANEACVGQFFY